MCIKRWFLRQRFYLNSKFKNLSLLEKVRKSLQLALFCLTIWSLNYNLADNLLGSRIISISNDSVAQAEELDVSGGEQDKQLASDTISVQAPPIEIKQLIAETFPEAQNEALALFYAESGHKADTESYTDKMADGRPFSIGLTQINLTVHEIDGVRCYEAFSGRNYRAIVINEELYSRCVNLAKDPVKNIITARGIYDRNGGNFLKWGAYTNGSYKKFL